ncbi:hypothetical protein TYRP_011897 [Tyrophagus putrescentiae]|nr:hypothetical protein TYRP_011897 [Tyrophagus putrescentiae]
MPPPPLVITPAGALCCDGEDHHKFRRRCEPQDRRRPGWMATRMEDDQNRR